MAPNPLPQSSPSGSDRDRPPAPPDELLKEAQSLWDKCQHGLRDLSAPQKRDEALKVSRTLLQGLKMQRLVELKAVLGANAAELRSEIPQSRRIFVARALDLRARVEASAKTVPDSQEIAHRVARLALEISPSSYEALSTFLGTLRWAKLTPDAALQAKFGTLVKFLQADPLICDDLPESVLRFSKARIQKIADVLRLASSTAEQLGDAREAERFAAYVDCLEGRRSVAEVNFQFVKTDRAQVPQAAQPVRKIEPPSPPVVHHEAVSDQALYGELVNRSGPQLAELRHIAPGVLSQARLEELASVLRGFDTKDFGVLRAYVARLGDRIANPSVDLEGFCALLTGRALLNAAAQAAGLPKDLRDACAPKAKAAERAARALHKSVPGSAELHATFLTAMASVINAWRSRGA